MIVRIAGEGQFQVADDDLANINELDAALEQALTAGDDGFAAALEALLAHIREVGTPVADDALVGSAVVLPAGDATADEVREMLGEDGLIPG